VHRRLVHIPTAGQLCVRGATSCLLNLSIIKIYLKESEPSLAAGGEQDAAGGDAAAADAAGHRQPQERHQRLHVLQWTHRAPPAPPCSRYPKQVSLN